MSRKINTGKKNLMHVISRRIDLLNKESLYIHSFDFSRLSDFFNSWFGMKLPAYWKILRFHHDLIFFLKLQQWRTYKIGLQWWYTWSVHAIFISPLPLTCMPAKCVQSRLLELWKSKSFHEMKSVWHFKSKIDFGQHVIWIIGSFK